MNSKLEIFQSLNKSPSQKFSEFERKIIDESNSIELTSFLTNAKIEDYEVKDIQLWLNIIAKFNDHLIRESVHFVPQVSVVDGKEFLKPASEYVPTFENYIASKALLISIFKVLRYVIANASDKQYFHSYEIAANYMLSWDFDLVEASTDLMYHLCIPTASIVSYSTAEYELKDNLELSQSLATLTLNVFEGLGFSSPDYGMVEYFKSIVMPPYSIMDEEICVGILNQQNDPAQSKSFLYDITVSLNATLETPLMHPISLPDYTQLTRTIHSFVESYKFNKSQFIMTLCILRSASALRGSVQSRIRILLARVKCFYILIHARLPLDSILPYISAGCTFVKDALTLSDINSETFSELKQLSSDSYRLSTVCSECLVGLLSLVIRRRGALMQQCGILQDLGLRQPVRSGRREDENNGSLSQEINWISIISSSCNIATHLLLNGSSNENFSFELNTKFNRSWQIHEDFFKSCFELFILCVSTPDSQAFTQYTPLILLQANIVRYSLPELRNAFEILSVNSSLDFSVMTLISKSLLAIEFVIEKVSSRSQPSPISILQDADFMSTFGSLLDCVNDGMITLKAKNSWPSCLILLLNKTFSFLSRYYKVNRRRMISATDAGIQLVQCKSFVSICNLIFKSNLEGCELLWNELLLLLKEAVDLDPPFHSVVMQSTYFTAMTNRLKAIAIVEPNAKIHELLYSLTRLLRVMCVSTDAHEFIFRNQLLPFIMSSCSSSSCILPASSGINIESIGNIGKTIVTTMKDVEKLRDSVVKHMDSLLISTCKEAQLTWETKVKLGETPTINTPRLQILQKLTNVCALEESFHTEMKRLSSSSRDMFSDAKLLALVNSYMCTLPPSKQLFAQLGTRQSTQSSHYGHSASAKEITSLLKSAASATPQTLLPILLKAIENTLIQISVQKQLLRGKSSSKDVPSHDVFTLENIQKARKQRTRGSSLGDDNGDIFILGVLDAIPHKCSFDNTLIEDFGSDSDLERGIWKFLTHVLYLEWLTFILSYTLRPSPLLTSRLIDKDIIRRLFAFHKSALMEVCRFNSSKLKPKSMKEFSSHNYGDNITAMDSSEDEVKIPRIPMTYRLRVVSAVGALLREDCEIEGSRVVLLAENSTISVAYERNQTASGVVRYRTAHGWMSEFRKDSQSEILELMEVEGSNSEVPNVDYKNETLDQRTLRRLKEMMTLRESACFTLSRINITLRIVAMHLSHSVTVYQPRTTRGRRESDSLSPMAGTVSKVLSKVMKGLYTYPFECIPDDEYPPNFDQFCPNFTANVSTVRDDKDSSKKNSSVRRPSMKTLKLSGQLDGNEIEYRPLNPANETPSKSKSAEAITVDKATLCLYFEAVSKFILIPVLDDRNGNLNTHLLKYLQQCSGLENIVDSILYVMACYCERSNISTELTRANQAALRSLPHLLSIIRKINTPKAISQSQITLSMKSSAPFSGSEKESISYDVYDLLFYSYSVLCEKLLPVMRRKFISDLPGEIQLEWFNIISELRINLGTKLPFPEKKSNGNSDNGPQTAMNSLLSNLSRELFYDLRARTNAVAAGNLSAIEESAPDIPVRESNPPNTSELDLVISMCEDMGFSRQRASAAYEATRSTNIEVLMEFMITQPDEQFEPLLESNNLLSTSNSSTSAPSSESVDTSNISTGVSDTHQPAVDVSTLNQQSSAEETSGRLTRPISLPPLPPIPHIQDLMSINESNVSLSPNIESSKSNKAINESKSIQQGALKDDEPSEHSKMELELRRLYEDLSIELIVENFHESIARIGDKDSHANMSFIPQLFAVIKKFCSDSIPTFFQRLLEQSYDALRPDSLSKQSLYGTLNMCLCFLRSNSTRLQLLFKKSQALDMFTAILNSLKIVVEEPADSWPAWVSTALVILYDVMTSVDSNIDTSSTFPESLRPIDNFNGQLKIENVLTEEKSNDTRDKAFNTSYIEKVSSWIGEQVCKLDMVPKYLWRDSYYILEKMITKMSNTEANTALVWHSEIFQGVMLLLSLTVSDEKIRVQAVEDGLTGRILRIPKQYSSKDNAALLSIFIQSLIRSRESLLVDIKQTLLKIIKDERLPTEKKKHFPLTELIEKLKKISKITCLSSDLANVILHVCEFYELSGADNENGGEIGVIYVRPRDNVDSFTERSKDDSGISLILSSLLYHVVTKSYELSMYSSPDVINVVFELIQTQDYKLLPYLSKLLNLDVYKLNETSGKNISSSQKGSKSKINFIDYLINNYFTTSETMKVEKDPKIESENASTNVCKASSQLMLALSARRGPLRRIVLNSIVKNIKSFSRPGLPDDEAKRLQALTKLSSFIPLIFKTVKEGDDNQVSSTLDIMVQLIILGICETLTEALAFIPLRNPLSSDAINSILEPLEVFSRPHYQNLIKDQIKIREISSAQNSNDHHTSRPDDEVDLSLDAIHDTVQSSNLSSETSAIQTINQYLDGQNSNLNVMRHYLSNRENQIESPNEHFRNEVDEIEEEDDEDEDGEDEDGEDEVLEGEDMEDEDVMEQADEVEHSENNRADLQARWEAVLSWRGLRNSQNQEEMLPENSERTSLTTPPDRIIADPLQLMINELNSDRMADSPEEMIRRLIRDASNEAATGVLSGRPASHTSTGMDTNMQIMLDPDNSLRRWRADERVRTSDRPLRDPDVDMGALARAGNIPVDEFEALASMYEARFPSLRQRRNPLRPALGESDYLNSVLFDGPRVDVDNLSESVNSRADVFLSSSRSALMRESSSRATTSRNTPVVDMFVNSLSTAISALVIRIQPEERPVIPSTSSYPEDSSVETPTGNVLVEVGDASRPSIPLNDNTAILEAFTSSQPLVEDAEHQDFPDGASGVSELTRTVGDLHTVGSVSESVGESYAGSFATEGVSHLGTVGEGTIGESTIVTASILTSDAIRGHQDYDEVSMLSSIPTTDSDEENENESAISANVDPSPVFEVLPPIYEEDFNAQNEEDGSVDANDTVEAVEAHLEIPEDNLVVETGDFVLPGGSGQVITATNDEASSVEVQGIPFQQSGLVCPPGFERDVFDSLPESMQREIIEQHSETNQQTRQLIENAGYDYEMFTSLPENIQQEILEQARRDQQPTAVAASSADSAPDDNASFLLSLTPDLRAEILLTAEPAFLASLPIQLQAEAQQYRDQAARRIQEREVRSHAIVRESAAGPVDTNGDYEEDEPPRRLAISGSQLRSSGLFMGRSPPSPLQTDGLFRIPNDDITVLALPLRLLAVVTKVLCSTTVKVNANLLQQLLHNLSKNPFTRDVSLRLLVSLLANDSSMFKSVLLKLDISPYAAEAVYELLLKSSDAFLLSTARGCSLKRLTKHIQRDTPRIQSKKLSGSTDDMLLYFGDDELYDASPAGSTWTIPRYTLQSLIIFLSQLFASNNSALFDALRPRKTKGGDFVDELSESIKLTSDSSEKIFNFSNDSIGSNSSNSLFEIVVSLLSHDDLTRNTNDLAALTSLICKMSAPLEILIKSQTMTSDEIQQKMKEREAQDKSKGVMAVIVPQVILSTEALTSLCDTLLSDVCSRKIFSDITTVISRLTVNGENREILLNLLVNVTEDLAEQSNCKLRSLFEVLSSIRNNEQSFDNSRASSLLSPQSKSQSSLTLIPTHELGGRQHDHLLRTIQTLVVIASKNKKDLNDIIPLSSFSPLWNSLDEVLSCLRTYVSNDDANGDELEKPGNSISDRTSRALASQTTAPAVAALSPVSSSIPTAASLTFILNRILPAVQSLFLALTHDMLTFSEVESESQSKNLEQSAQSATELRVDPNSNSQTTLPSVNILGGRHRKSDTYKRMNINLYSESSTSLGSPHGAIEEVTLQKSRSMPRSISNLSALSHSPIHARAHRLLAFVHSHKNLLNILIKSQPNLLEKSFSSLIRVVQLRPYVSFENKRKFFTQQLHLSRRGPVFNTIHLRLRRASIFEDTYEQLRSRSGEELNGRFQIDFYGEQGIDAGGLTREFYNILSREIFNPNYALFDAAADAATFQPNPSSNINSNHLSYFKFVGQIIGKAICDGQLMDAHFTRSFYKHVLGVPVDYVDIEATEPDYYNTLKQILENPLEALMIDLTFSAESHIFGKVEIVDLIPNGRNIPVTDENKFEYIRLIAHHRTTAAIKAQIESFLDGFYELVPPDLICIFSPAELELLICGLPDVDIENLKANTDYNGYRSSDEIITWFWEALNSFSRAEKASFVQFVTGTSKVPLGGFANLQGMRGTQRCSIHKAFGDPTQLPTAHTCFNQLDLPMYSSAEELREKLLLAIKEGSEGFGFA